MVTSVPPQAIEIESAILGAMINDPECIPDVVAKLKPNFFYQEKHRRIFEALRQMENEKASIDLLTVSEFLKSAGFLEEIGGSHYLAECSTTALSTANIDYHCGIVVDKYCNRKLINQCQTVTNDAFSKPADENIASMTSGISEIENILASRTDVINSNEGIQRLMNKIEWYEQNKGKRLGVSIGYRTIETIIPSIEPGETMLLAARPSIGKTAFACNITRSASFNGKKTGWILLESTADKIWMRLTCQQARVDNYKIKSGNLLDADWGAISGSFSRLNNNNIFISEDAGCNLDQMKSRIQHLIRKYGCELIIIDYIQQVSHKSENRNRELEQIMGAIKSIGIQHKVSMLALSQLSRDTEKRQDKRPILSDLRDSGALEQDADIVAFIHRENAYLHPSERKVSGDGSETAEFIVRKNRDGAVGTIELQFNNKYGTFEEGE